MQTELYGCLLEGLGRFSFLGYMIRKKKPSFNLESRNNNISQFGRVIVLDFNFALCSYLNPAHYHRFMRF